MDVKELMDRAGRLYNDAEAILTNPESTAEDKAKVPAMLEDAKKAKAEAFQLKEIEAHKAEILERKPATPEGDKAASPARTADKFANMGEFWLAVANAGNVKNHYPLDRRLRTFNDKDEPAHSKEHGGQAGWEDKATMVENVGARGGFLVPTEFLPQLQAVNPMVNVVRSRATVIPMRRRSIQIPVLNQTGTTAGQGHWFGGIVSYWMEEGGTKTQADATFRQVELVAHKLINYTRSSDELLDDSAVGLDAFLRGPLGFSGAIDWHEEYAFLRGTGAGQPLGVVNAGATISVAATANPPAPGSLYGDLVNMLESFLPGANGVWVVNQRHMSDLLTMNGPSANPSYLWGNAVAGQPNTLLGYPVIWTEKLPAPGSAGSILLADFRYYLIGDRQATTIDSTNIERFQYDETSWRAVHRVDGQPWLSAPITLTDGTAQISPFVILGAKST